MTPNPSQVTANESISTVIDAGILIDGNIKVESGKSLLIKGQFTGSLESNGVVVIGEGAVCIGSLTAREVRVAGAIRKSGAGVPNTVVAKEALVVEGTGIIDTDTLSYGAIELQYGARVAGTLSPIQGVESPKQEPRVQPQTVHRTPVHTPAPVAAHQASAVTAPSTVSLATRAAAIPPAAPTVVRSGLTPLVASSMPGVPVSLMNVGGDAGEFSEQRTAAA